MSLIVSLRVPDGIVVAADSLATAQSRVEIQGELNIVCPECKKEIKQTGLKLPAMNIPFSASSYTQKLFALYKKYSVSSCGQGIINNKSILYHIKQFQVEHSENPADLAKIADLLVNYFSNQLERQFPKYREKAPDNFAPIIMHLNGHETVKGQLVGITYEVWIGKQDKITRIDSLGCTTSGENAVARKLYAIGEENNRLRFKYPFFSLQDAIDHADFLINTTSIFQRFAHEVSNVGGDIDIALVTPFDGFRWIRRKKLMEIIEEEI
ncbi:hypothetical protein KKI24_09030 [bacterium]|nr:hypothetical protein [bacterium]